MDTLPETVVEEIFSYLAYADLQSMRLVNKKYHRISLSHSLVDREVSVYDGKIQVDDFDYWLITLSTIKRTYYHFRFLHVIIKTEQFQRLIDDRGLFIRSLEFNKCTIGDYIGFWRYLGQCVNLKSLILMNCNTQHLVIELGSHYGVTLSSLEYFHVEPVSIKDQFSLETLMEIAPNAKNLRLDGSSKHNYPICAMLCRKDETLNRLEIISLSRNDCTRENVIEIANSNFLKLKEIRLEYCQNVTSPDLRYLFEKQRQLQVLRLGYWGFVDNESLFDIADCLSNLKTLEIRNILSETTGIFDGLMRITSRTSVRQLRFTSHFPYGDEPAVLDAINVAPIPNNNLRELDITNSVPLSLERIECIVRNFQDLAYLNLEYSTSVNNDGLRLICKYLKKLKILNLSACDQISDDGFDNKGTYPSFCESLSNLEELYLNDCSLISDVTVQNYLKLPYLRILDLNDCKKLTVNSFTHLSRECSSLPSLQTLNVNSITVTNEMLMSTIPLFRRLRAFYIQVDGGISDKSLESLYKCMNYLMQIRIYHRLSVNSFVRSWKREGFVRSCYLTI